MSMVAERVLRIGPPGPAAGYRLAAPPAPTSPVPEVPLRSADGFAIGARTATAGAVLFAVFYPLLVIGEVIADGQGRILPTVALTVPILALHVWFVWECAHGGRPRAPWPTVVALAVLVAAGFAISLPVWWAEQAHIVLAATVLLLRGRSRIAATAVVLAALVYVLRDLRTVEAVYTAWLVLWRAGQTVAFTWFAVALRRLVATRRALADEALLAERHRIDGQLDRTVGAAIASVATGAEELATRARSGGVVAAGEIETVTDRSRAALADVRLVARSYRSTTLSDELAAAERLLTDAGVAARVVPPVPPLGPSATAAVRDELRAALRELLGDASVLSCELAVVEPGEGTADARLDVRVERSVG